MMILTDALKCLYAILYQVSWPAIAYVNNISGLEYYKKCQLRTVD